MTSKGGTTSGLDENTNPVANRYGGTMVDHDIVVAGKSPPEPDELMAATDRGFDAIELYLERTHLDAVDESLANVRDVGVDVVSVHTPHVPIDEPAYLRAADELADELDSYLVVHSNRIIHTFTSALEDLGFRAEYGYENNPGASARHVRHLILEPGHDFVLDTAHLFMAEAEYLEQTSRLLREYADQIPVVHLCDSTPTVDGLGFGEGEMDMERLVAILRREFEGTIVLEVMPEEQTEARERFERWY